MQRRNFLKAITVFLNSLIGAALAVPALGYVFDPVRRRKRTTGFVRVATLSSLTEHQPIRVTVHADRWDSFIHHPPGPIGSVWLILDDRSEEHASVRCLQTVCPHLGCGIDYAPKRAVFSCPCHDSEFDVDGKPLGGPAPRAMDELPCRITEADEHGRKWVEVQYQEFRIGVREKRPVA